MNKNTVLLTLGSIILVFGFLFAAYFATNKSAPSSQQSTQANEKVNTLGATDHIKWSKNKKVLLVEYADLQCPACQAWEGYFTQLETSQDPDDKKIIDGVTLVYRHFPLSGHKHAQEAAYAAEAAGRQGKFFEYADILFEQQSTWSGKGSVTTLFEEYARDAGLDIGKFRADKDSKEVKDVVETQRVSGLDAAVNSTPTFFLNGRKLKLRTFEELRDLLLKELL